MKTQANKLAKNLKPIIEQALNACVHSMQIRINDELLNLDFEYSPRATIVKVRFNFTFTTRDFFHREFNEQVTQKIIRFIEQTMEGAAA